MAEAEVGDEQQRLDPSVNRLCEEIAELLGKEAAVFLPSGTMCNQIAMAVHLSLIHISEPTIPLYISYAVFCLKNKIEEL